MTWIASTPQARRAQFGTFLLGTGNIGGMATSTGPGIGLSDEDGLALIDRAVEQDFKILDTADVYTGGNSERVVGLWNKAHPDSDVLIQTKTGMTAAGPDLNPQRLERQLEHSIETIGRVDLFVAHAVDPNTPWEASLPVFSEAVRSKRIRAYGLSNIDAPGLTAALETADRLDLVRPEVIQNSYSLLVREDEDALLPIVRSESLAYTPYSPLANGLLTGRYSKGERPATGSRASTGRRVPGFLDDPDLMQRLARFDQLAAEHGVSSAGLAFAWLIHQPLVTAPIIGISRPQQWDGVHEAMRLELTPELSAALDALFPPR
jgi:aryl-alcohol dehydrogenase-like predicted oxidoreductase